jgi:hypothetical protein
MRVCLHHSFDITTCLAAEDKFATRPSFEISSDDPWTTMEVISDLCLHGIKVDAKACSMLAEKSTPQAFKATMSP